MFDVVTLAALLLPGAAWVRGAKVTNLLEFAPKLAMDEAVFFGTLEHQGQILNDAAQFAIGLDGVLMAVRTADEVAALLTDSSLTPDQVSPTARLAGHHGVSPHENYF